jgi:hypothetical protein
MLNWWRLVAMFTLVILPSIANQSFAQEIQPSKVILFTDTKSVRPLVHLPKESIEISGKATFILRKMHYDDSLSGYLNFEIDSHSLAKISVATKIPSFQLSKVVRFDEMRALPIKDTSCPKLEIEFDPKYYSTEVNYLGTKMAFPKFSLKLQILSEDISNISELLCLWAKKLFSGRARTQSTIDQINSILENQN